MPKKTATKALRALGILFAAYVIFTVGYNVGLQNPAGSVQPTVSAANKRPAPPTRAELLKLVNAERAKAGVAPLKEDPRLDVSAQMKAEDEVKYDYFGHVNPVTHVTNFVGLIDQTGIACKTDSENLAWNTDKSTITAKDAVDWWIGSRAHHRAMVDPKYTLTGFGIVNDAVVQHFCEQ